MRGGDKNKSASMERSLQLQTFGRHVTRSWDWPNICSQLTNIQCTMHGYQPQHNANATVKYFHEILVELYKIQTSRNDSEVAGLVFIAGIMIFCSNEPIGVIRNNLSLLSNQWFCLASYLESLLQMVPSNSTLNKLLQQYLHELKLLETGSSEQLCHQGKELMLKNIRNQLQQELSPTSIASVPTWVLTRFPENETRSILQIINAEVVLPYESYINGEVVLPYESFAYPLVSWLNIGCPGNDFFKNVRNNLPKMFRSRCLHLAGHIREALHMLARTKAKPEKIGLFSDKHQKYFSCPSTSSSGKFKILETYASRGRKLHFTFPQKMRKWHPLASLANGETSTPTKATNLNDYVPLEFLSFFHKALKKDVENLVSISAKLAENVGCIMEFRRLLEILQLQHRLRSDANGQCIIPTLEAKTKQLNISWSYTFDHELEAKYLDEVSVLLDEIFKLQSSGSITNEEMLDMERINFPRLCSKLSNTCQAFQKLFSDHISREGIELWPAFSQCFSVKEQEKIIANILGRTSAETIQALIPCLTSCLTPEEQQVMMSMWRRICKHTMFDDWLEEWWDGYGTDHVEESSSNTVSRYPSVNVFEEQFYTVSDKDISFSLEEFLAADIEMLEDCSLAVKGQNSEEDQNEDEFSKRAMLYNDAAKVAHSKLPDITERVDCCKSHLAMNQDNLETPIRRVSRDSAFNIRRKAQATNNIVISQQLVRQQNLHTEAGNSPKSNSIPGKHPSYRDPLKQTFGCRHYKRSCKLVTSCCNQLYTCIRCHDETADHSTKRRAISEMMCMKCLVVQPIAQNCSTSLCNNFSMAKYYCSICKLFDDEREIYHCPYCNLCRVGKGLGTKYFHCMNCNACMSQSLSIHVCREKCFEDNCSICREHFFTSSSPVKALPCGHLMHSTCFEEYTSTRYTCPICSKSLGDMQVYFQMLDEMLAAEEMPDEYSGKHQAILCNDCEKKGFAPFHWVYHKCSYCGSYNTRLI